MADIDAPIIDDTPIYYGPGEEPIIWHPGDIILTHGDALVSKVIQWGQRLRLPREFCYYNHAACVVGEDGTLVESLSHGPEITHADHYKPTEYHVIHAGLTAEEADNAVRYAYWTVANKTHYGWIQIASVAFRLLTGSKFFWGLDGTIICSAEAAGFLAKGPYNFLDVSQVLPGTLAELFNVRP